MEEGWNTNMDHRCRWGVYLELGTLTRTETLKPPADSPKMVTEPGLPPKLAMLSWTQRSAATWSK